MKKTLVTVLTTLPVGQVVSYSRKDAPCSVKEHMVCSAVASCLRGKPKAFLAYLNVINKASSVKMETTEQNGVITVKQSMDDDDQILKCLHTELLNLFNMDTKEFYDYKPADSDPALTAVVWALARQHYNFEVLIKLLAILDLVSEEVKIKIRRFSDAKSKEKK